MCIFFRIKRKLKIDMYFKSRRRKGRNDGENNTEVSQKVTPTSDNAPSPSIDNTPSPSSDNAPSPSTYSDSESDESVWEYDERLFW